MNFIAPYRYNFPIYGPFKHGIDKNHKNLWDIKLMRFINLNENELVQHSWNMTNQFWSIRFKK